MITIAHAETRPGLTFTRNDQSINSIETPFRGKNNDYIIVTHMIGRRPIINKDGSLARPEYTDVVADIVNLYLAVNYFRNEELGIERAKRSLSHPRTYIEMVLHNRIPVAYGIFPKFTIEGIPVVHSTRMITKEHQGELVGGHLFQNAVEMHQRDRIETHRSPILWGALETQNPASIASLEKIPWIGTIFPFHKLYSEDPVARRLVGEVYNKISTEDSLNFNRVTGVSTGELSALGMNEAYRPREGEGRVREIYLQMIRPFPRGLAMNREDGDLAYTMLLFQYPVSIK